MADSEVTATVTIGDDVYTLVAMSAIDSFAYQALVAPIAARAVALLLKMYGDKSAKLTDINSASLLLKAPGYVVEIGEAVASVPPEALKRLCQVFFAKGKRGKTPLFVQEGSDEPFNTIMRGKVINMWLLFIEAMRLNYPDFFALFVGSGAKLPTVDGDGSSPGSSISPGAGPSTG